MTEPTTEPAAGTPDDPTARGQVDHVETRSPEGVSTGHIGAPPAPPAGEGRPAPTPEGSAPAADPAHETSTPQGQTEPPQEEPETFPRAYVEQLRQENAEQRVRARRADDLAQRLHTALVAATGRLADPTDLPYEETHLADQDALSSAVDDLLARKPHLASRRVTGSIGQGPSEPGQTVDLAGLLRARA